MRVKVLEVRDEGTHVEVFAMSVEASPGQEYGLSRSGFAQGSNAIILGYLSGEQNSSADPYHWNSRTMHYAHQHITAHFEELSDGDVVDVRSILDPDVPPARSDRFYGVPA